MVDIRDKAALKEAAAIQATIINRTIAENRELHADLGTLEQAEREHNAAVVVQHRAETAGLTVGQRIGLAAGDNAARAHERSKQTQRDARGVPAQSASKGLAELVHAGEGEAPEVIQPEQAPVESDGIGLNDL